jgi:CRP-like cAMP-binding protein
MKNVLGSSFGDRRARVPAVSAMNENSESFYGYLFRKLAAVSGITDGEKQAIAALPYAPREFAADQDIVKIGELPSETFTIVEGWVCRYKMLPEGGRQIMSFHIPGDLPDLQSVFLPRLDHSIAAITPTKVAFIRHRDLRDLMRKHEGIASAFWRDALIDAAIFREWMVGIGRRTAHQRIAHLLCEMATKLESIGLAEGNSYPWPVTQVEIADALGLTDVHVNRVIGDYKREGLASFRRGSFTVHDWPAFKALGQFDPLYLHLQGQAA